jgi:predicted transcriptional regulator of viral defense system
MKYKGISPRENRLLNEISLRSIKLMTPRIAGSILGEDRENVHRILNRMTYKGLLTRIERGKYVVSGGLDRNDLFEVATLISVPSYISLWTGLNFYHLTTQVPSTIFVMTMVPRKAIELQEVRIRFVKTSHFFGYTRISNVVVAEVEKLFLDCLVYPHYSGGVDEIVSSMEKSSLDNERLLEYAGMMDVRALNSRLGYILEKYDLGPADPLRGKISTAYAYLDPTSPKKGERNKKWRIIDNMR